MNAELTAHCAYLFETLKKNGVKSVTMEFSGSGDNGQLDWGDVVQDENDDFSWEMPTIFEILPNHKMTLIDLIFNVTQCVLGLYGVDYEEGQGNEGNVIFDVTSGKITTSYQVHTLTEKEETLYI